MVDGEVLVETQFAKPDGMAGDLLPVIDEPSTECGEVGDETCRQRFRLY